MTKLFPRMFGALLGALIFAVVGIGMANAQHVGQSDSRITVDGSPRR